MCLRLLLLLLLYVQAGCFSLSRQLGLESREMQMAAAVRLVRIVCVWPAIHARTVGLHGRNRQEQGQAHCGC